jgi:hypothetical protein
MDQLTVSLDGQDHLVGEDETTLCGKVVPMGSSQVPDTDPCPECFPETVAKPKAKPAKKATNGKVI